jgi:SCY1-like protein 2
MQEKIIPLIKGIKTKEPAVAIAALNVIRQVGGVADADFVAMDILPILWSMSLGPLLDLKQFQSFMELIKSLSSRVESEQTRKLQELGGSNGVKSNNEDFMSFGTSNAFSTNPGPSDDPEIDFERLVKGDSGVAASSNPLDSGWDAVPVASKPSPLTQTAKAPSFSWSTPSPTTAVMPQASISSTLRAQQGPSRTITPDLSKFDALSPTSTQFSQPLQPQSAFNAPMKPQQPNNYNTGSVQAQSYSNYNSSSLQPQAMFSYQTQPAQPTVNWNMSSAVAANPWAAPPAQTMTNPTLGSMTSSMSNLSMNRPTPSTNNAFSLPPPTNSGFSLPPPPGGNSFGAFSSAPPSRSQSAFGTTPSSQLQPTLQKTGLDAYESLI